VNLRLGDVMPLLTSATGRCFAAFVSKEAIAPMLKEEIARAQKLARKDMPTTLAQARAMLDEVRQRGAARVVDTLLPGIVWF
jgi:DNA-binding IclR family transcriptional regulator